MKTKIPCKKTYSKDDDCWYVEAPGFYKGFMTYGDSLEDAKTMAGEAVAGLLETYLEHGDNFNIPVPDDHNNWYDIEIEIVPSFAFRLSNVCNSSNIALAEVSEKMGCGV